MRQTILSKGRLVLGAGILTLSGCGLLTGLAGTPAALITWDHPVRTHTSHVALITWDCSQAPSPDLITWDGSGCGPSPDLITWD